MCFFSPNNIVGNNFFITQLKKISFLPYKLACDLTFCKALQGKLGCHPIIRYFQHCNCHLDTNNCRRKVGWLNCSFYLSSLWCRNQWCKLPCRFCYFGGLPNNSPQSFWCCSYSCSANRCNHSSLFPYQIWYNSSHGELFLESSVDQDFKLDHQGYSFCKSPPLAAFNHETLTLCSPKGFSLSLLQTLRIDSSVGFPELDWGIQSDRSSTFWLLVRFQTHNTRQRMYPFRHNAANLRWWQTVELTSVFGETETLFSCPKKRKSLAWVFHWNMSSLPHLDASK